ncbi:MAG: phenylalanine--tRNA ligase subunit beta [Deltaproteobacteria bacterium]|jgi:phenylalanyl-tRNA synthetase beta chain|nr:phenylalanine--tRNA ligase subunit beta [Deltaproteobacteria bacterium]
MKVTLNWLKEYVDCDLKPEKLAHRLTMAGLEVDAISFIGTELDSVVVARLAEVKPHPEADRLTLCQVDTENETFQVVCGATNHKEGNLVAFAQIGTTLPGNFKIKKSKIRGQVSHGMLCSTKELGLGDEAAGIMILPEGLQLGKPVFDALGLKDVLYELGLTPNRPDCLSVVGVAREVAAIVDGSLKPPIVSIEESDRIAGNLTSISIEDIDLCPRYAARLIENVKIGPSPDWLVRRLEAVGMRSINNVVDITNFVMLELGHPLHAFDFNLLNERRIVVKRAQQGDKFITLDSQERLLQEDDLVICDGKGPIALAGIMGGLNSEVQPNTRDILLESAYFSPIAIRRTSKRLGLHTESSHRFERGADVDMVPLALDRAASLIAEYADGTIASGVIDNYPQPLQRRNLSISLQKTNQLLGLNLSLEDIRHALESIDIQIVQSDKGNLKVSIPNFRPDIEREIDLIEEVARLIGYDRIPVTMPTSLLTCQRPASHLQLANLIRNSMIKTGFSEVINYSFINPLQIEKLGLSTDDKRQNGVKLLNPLSEDQSVMRTSLIPSLLEVVARNLAYRSDNLALFEMRPVFYPSNPDDLPLEKLRLTAALCGRREREGWAQLSNDVDFYDIKGCVEMVLESLRIKKVHWHAVHDEPFYHPGKSCILELENNILGSLGELHPEILRKFDLSVPVYLCDLDVEALIALRGSLPEFQPLSRYPDIQRDSAFLVDEGVSAQEIFDVLNRVTIKDMESIVLFDVYRGQGVPHGKKSMAIRARYRALDRTLTDELIQNLHGKLVKALKKELGAEIR